MVHRSGGDHTKGVHHATLLLVSSSGHHYLMHQPIMPARRTCWFFFARTAPAAPPQATPSPTFIEEASPPQATPVNEKPSSPQTVPPPPYEDVTPPPLCTENVNPQASLPSYTHYFLPPRVIGLENTHHIEGHIFLRIKWASLTEVEVSGEATKCWAPQPDAQELSTKALLMSFGNFYLAMEGWSGSAKSPEMWLHMAALKTEVKQAAAEDAGDYLLAELEKHPCFISRSDGPDRMVINAVQTEQTIIIRTQSWTDTGDSDTWEEMITSPDAALACMTRCHHDTAITILRRTRLKKPFVRQGERLAGTG